MKLSLSNKILLFLAIIIIILASILIIFLFLNNEKADKASDQAIIKINNQTISAEVVSTPQKMSLGLSYRDSLDDNNGMLFVYKSKQMPVFWMKEMRFPLDMVWIADNQIVDISFNVPVPESQANLPIYKPNQEVHYVLEVNAGYAQKNNIQIGDMVDIQYK